MSLRNGEFQSENWRRRSRTASSWNFPGAKEKVDNLLTQRFTMLRELSPSSEGGIWKVRLVLDSREAIM